MNTEQLIRSIDYQEVLSAQRIKEITGVEIDSRKVKKGDVFVCLKGEHADGHDFIEKAVENGASAIVIEKDVPMCSDIPYIKVSSTVRALAEISQKVYGNPTKELKLIGVTGTNGKTSVTHFLNQLYRMKGYKTGVMGTMHTDIDGDIYPTDNTTPFAHDVQRIFRQMREGGVTHAFMEVSSHGLAMGRIWGCDFSHAAFTNLSQDHLDYHKTMEEYKRAKGLLFTSLGFGFDKTAVLNADDEATAFYQSITGTNVLTYGIRQPADIQATSIEQNETGLAFHVHYKGEGVDVQTSLMGEFHVYNLLCAFGICLSEGWALKELENLAKNIQPVKGRMENVSVGQDFDVIVDFAHTPDGLENALKSLKRNAKGRVLTLFGCGGDRDRTKRPLMASIAEKYSHFVMITSDNPRTEDPSSILDEVETGMESKNYKKEVDRKKAIQEIIRMAGKGDVVILAGKGHEEYQIIGKEKTHFSDREEAENAILNR